MQLNAVSSLLPPAQLFPAARPKPQVPSPIASVPPVSTVPPVAEAPEPQDTESPVTADDDAGIFGGDRFSLFSEYAGQAASGAYSAFRHGENTSNFYREISKAFQRGGNGWADARPGIEGAIMSGVRGAGVGALVSAGVAVASHGFQAARGEMSVEDFTDRVLNDALNGAFSGFGGATLGGAGHLIMSSMGMAGLPLKIGTAIAGAVGGVVLAQMSQPMTDEDMAETAA